ncbi:MAG: DoxX family protein [Gammaproteobacteria bacterium]|nr:DoxX family protein [Gammaproteobacteria bacterium]
MKDVVLLVGRLFMASIFLISGFHKITGYAGTQAFMQSHGVPGMLLPLVILLELGGGTLLVLGWQTRLVAWLFAGFTLAAALIFHTNFSDQSQVLLFMLHMPIVGGFLVLAAHGAGGLSLDGGGRLSAD